MIHLMVDLETLSTEPNALVLSIGAVIFDENLIYDEFYCILNQTQQRRQSYKFHVSESTVQWWEKQNDEAKKLLTLSRESDVTPEKAKEVFNEFLQRNISFGENFMVWANGADFDLPILKNLFNNQVPWNYSNQRCYRTEKRLFTHLPVGLQGVKHNALDDARYQAQNLMQHFKLFPQNNK